MDVRIRHAEVEDYKAIHEVYSQPKAIAGTLQLPYPSEALWQKRLAEVPDGVYVLVAEVQGQVRGSLGLHTETNRPRRRHVGHIGMAVHDDWQHQGIGTELLAAAIDLADNWLNLVRLELSVFTDNTAAFKLYQKFGFATEGTLRQYAFKGGELCDVYTMARIKR